MFAYRTLNFSVHVALKKQKSQSSIPIHNTQPNNKTLAVLPGDLRCEVGNLNSSSAFLFRAGQSNFCISSRGFLIRCALGRIRLAQDSLALLGIGGRINSIPTWRAPKKLLATVSVETAVDSLLVVLLNVVLLLDRRRPESLQQSLPVPCAL